MNELVAKDKKINRQGQTYSLDDVKGAPVALAYTHCSPVDVTVVFQQGIGEPRFSGYVKTFRDPEEMPDQLNDAESQ